MKDLSFFKDQFIPNFDGTETEPTFLPFQVPNILVSGSTGIAVGMATNIPTHNLGEVIDATVMYLNDPDVPLEDLLDVMKGPDFATGGIINASKEDLMQVYETGLGRKKKYLCNRDPVYDDRRNREVLGYGCRAYQKS